MRLWKWIAIVGFVAAAPLPASAQTLTTYQCRDGSQFAVAFHEADKSAHLQVDGKTMELKKRQAAVGVRYAKGDVTLRITKTGTTLKRGKHSAACSPR